MWPARVNSVTGSEQWQRPPGRDALGLAGALRWLSLSALIVVLDQLTKWYAVQQLAYGERIPVIAGCFDWTMAHNTGVAFSMFADGEVWTRWGLSGFALLVSAGFAIALARLGRNERFSALAFALVIGGAVGNIIDRVRLGYVIDFILWYWREWHWPAFNIADSAIVCGAAVLILFGWRDTKRAL
ncbi:MAG: lipoprotein signal peptidase [Xanthomonadales bacterium]|nr:lipoprotein signal peptidase [Xanthomonadales bacterium]